MAFLPSVNELVEMTRDIVARNRDYFQAKIRTSENQKPYAGHLHHQKKTPPSTYYSSFAPPQSYVLPLASRSLKSKDLEDNVRCTVSTLCAETSYQTSFRGLSKDSLSAEKALRAKPSFPLSQDLPGCFSTQNSTSYLNWGGNLQAIPTPPPLHHAATNLPFTSCSSYNLSFKAHRAQKIEPLCKRSPLLAATTTYDTDSSYNECYRNAGKNKLATLSYKVQEKVMRSFGKLEKSKYRKDYNIKQREYVFREKERTIEELQAIVLRM